MTSWDETKATCAAPQEGCVGQGYGAALDSVNDSGISTGKHWTQCTENEITSTSSGRNGVSYGKGDHSERQSHSSNHNSAHHSHADAAAESGNRDDNGSDNGESGPTIGISSRGRIVRSKFNIRKHLASKK